MRVGEVSLITQCITYHTTMNIFNFFLNLVRKPQKPDPHAASADGSAYVYTGEAGTPETAATTSSWFGGGGWFSGAGAGGDASDSSSGDGGGGDGGGGGGE